MQGKILDYNNEFKSGLIRGEDGNKYRFSIDDCKSDLKPRANAEVDFEANEDKAVEIYILTKDAIDTIKEATLSAADATVLAAKASTSVIKKIIPYAIVVSIVIVLISLIVAANHKYEEYKYEENIKTQQAKIKEDSDKAQLLFQDKKYIEALELYTDLYHRSNENIFKFMTVECLIELNNPIRAEAMLEKVDISDSFTNADGEQFNRNVDDKDKAKFYILRAKINRLNNDYKSLGGMAALLDTDGYYSQNAEEACKYGDCSLVKK